MVTRVKVFVDYQNVYHRARGTFGLENSEPFHGNVKPMRLGALVNVMGRDGNQDRTLTQVRVYRGEPTTKSHPKVQAAFQRQLETWRRDAAELLSINTRPLRYEVTRYASGRPVEWGVAREKGIDVMLAVDLVMGAMRNEYDVAVVISGDTDLLPAIEAAIDQEKRVENAVWWPDNGQGRPLRSSTHMIWCNRLTHTHYLSVCDATNYADQMPAVGHTVT